MYFQLGKYSTQLCYCCITHKPKTKSHNYIVSSIFYNAMFKKSVPARSISQNIHILDIWRLFALGIGEHHLLLLIINNHIYITTLTAIQCRGRAIHIIYCFALIEWRNLKFRKYMSRCKESRNLQSPTVLHTEPGTRTQDLVLRIQHVPTGTSQVSSPTQTVKAPCIYVGFIFFLKKATCFFFLIYDKFSSAMLQNEFNSVTLPSIK